MKTKTQTALKPDIYSEFMSMPAMRNQEEAEKKGLEPDDNALAFMSQTEGWKVLDKFIDNLKKDSEQFVLNALAQGYPRDEIGTYAIVASLLNKALDQIKNRVNDANDIAGDTGSGE